MSANRLFTGVLALVLVAASAPALACTRPPAASEAAVADNIRNYQADLWVRSDAVFLSQAEEFQTVDLDGIQGFRTTLAPSLVLKGGLPTAKIDIRHTTATSCGLIPFLSALTGTEGDWFVTYVRDLPSGLSVDATVPVSELVDAEALRAWRKAYPAQTATSED